MYHAEATHPSHPQSSKERSSATSTDPRLWNSVLSAIKQDLTHRANSLYPQLMMFWD